MSVLISAESTLPTHPPWKSIPGIYNFRDLGGYPIQGSTGSVRRNLIYRAAEPSRVTADGMAVLVATLNVTATYDLRSNPEIESLSDTCPVIEIPGITRHFVPVFEEDDLSPEYPPPPPPPPRAPPTNTPAPRALAKRYSSYTSGDLPSAYRSILTAGALLSYRAIFTHLLERPTEPLVIHCTAGKDRTGVVCALLLMLAGVDDEFVAAEYALTEVGLEPFKQAIRERLLGRPQFVKGDEEARRGLENMLSSTVETMRRTTAMIRDEFGGVEAYMVRDCGFTAEQVAAIKRNITSEERPCFGLDAQGELVYAEQKGEE
ncbi:uncharacterized protein H6S33_006354 [Morchella sextelata]|uniref:uncharacterized protein n=1 Tax=Morchella sextelata TaxID=1174677 RepID=UPI001D04A040|nr:uncharacterized protein H6S33_006354 [Morchella sextelata]KAH0604686.1 hypothetical protein H6S33_006354 [Morchella sextelata]